MAAGGRRPAPSRGTRRSRLLAVTEIGVVGALKRRTRSARRACPPPTAWPRRAASGSADVRRPEHGQGPRGIRGSARASKGPGCPSAASRRGTDLMSSLTTATSSSRCRTRSHLVCQSRSLSGSQGRRGSTGRESCGLRTAGWVGDEGLGSVGVEKPIPRFGV